MTLSKFVVSSLKTDVSSEFLIDMSKVSGEEDSLIVTPPRWLRRISLLMV